MFGPVRFSSVRAVGALAVAGALLFGAASVADAAQLRGETTLQLRGEVVDVRQRGDECRYAIRISGSRGALEDGTVVDGATGRADIETPCFDDVVVGTPVTGDALIQYRAKVRNGNGNGNGDRLRLQGRNPAIVLGTGATKGGLSIILGSGSTRGELSILLGTGATKGG